MKELMSCCDFMQNVTKVTSLEHDLNGMSSDVQHWIVRAAQMYDDYLKQQIQQEPILFVRESDLNDSDQETMLVSRFKDFSDRVPLYSTSITFKD
jgi:polyphosphate kinase